MPGLVPAYGRDYKSKKEAEDSFYAGQDFRVADISSPFDGTYCSVRDFKKGEEISIRYKKLTQKHIFKVK